MLKEFILFIKYPYTAGVIGIIWLGSAALMAIDQDLPFIRIVVINMILSIVISVFGFRGKKEI
jgi:hypothetical protein